MRVRVADLGCGIGTDAIELALRYPSSVCVTAVDISSSLLHYAEQQLPLRGSPTNILFLVDQMENVAENTYDVITVQRVLQHVSTHSLSLCVERIVRGVRDGGRIVVSEPDWTSFVCGDESMRERVPTWAASNTSSFQNPDVGRRLLSLFLHEALLAQCRVDVVQHTLTRVETTSVADSFLYDPEEWADLLRRRGLVDHATASAFLLAAQEADEEGRYRFALDMHTVTLQVWRERKE